MPPSLLDRIRERKLFRWAAAYLAGAWVLFEVASAVGSPLGWSDGFYRSLLVVLAAGFAATLVLAWYHGERGQQKVGALEAALLFLLLVVAIRGVMVVNARAGTAGGGGPEVASGAFDPAPGTIAVLSFRDLSEAGDQAFFAEGMAVEVQGLLSRVPGLRVAALLSSFSFREASIDVRVIGERLGVRYILDGAVMREADQVRISSQLIDARDGFQVWNGSYTRELRSVIEIQDEIAGVVVSELLPRLEARPVATRRTASTDAHLAYLRGRYHWARGANDDAVAAYEEAIALDSTFADAWAGLGTTLAVMATSDPTVRARAAGAVQRALALDPESPDALAAKARTDLTFQYDWAAAEGALERAVSLDPNHVETRHWYSHVLSWTGREEEGLEQARVAAVLDPLSPFMNLNLAVAQWWAGLRDEALVQLDHALQLDPGFALAYFYLWDYLLEAGRPDEAGEVLERWAGVTGAPPEAARGISRAIGEHIDSGRAVPVPQADMTRMGFDSPSWNRRVYAWLGQDELALDGLVQAHRDRAGAYDVLGLRHSGQYPSLREHPQFRQILEEVGPG
ncbi:MAG TPA: tetratricopeptide repeat protein [Longimicrobiales bacterium]|nr:tetratricopeptide repeat protein [Longimicrobiales bacterium]